MTPDDHQQVIDELQAVIDETQQTIERFENTGMEGDMPKDYDKLLTVLDDAVKQQSEHTLRMHEHDRKLIFEKFEYSFYVMHNGIFVCS